MYETYLVRTTVRVCPSDWYVTVPQTSRRGRRTRKLSSAVGTRGLSIVDAYPWRTNLAAMAGGDAAPQPPQLSQMIRQFAMLPVLWGSGKVDWEQEDNKFYLRCTFGTMVALGYLMIQLAVFKVKRINDSGRVANPGTISTLKDDMKAEDGSVSICQYDLAKLQESKFQYVMTAAISSLMHFHWGYTQPLVMLSVMLPLQIWDNKAVKHHMFGQDVGPRPWAAANADNPLAQWAERKKAEAEEAEKASKPTKAESKKKK